MLGVHPAYWIELFFASYSVMRDLSIIFNAWPDGGCYLEQPAVVVSVLKIIEDEYLKRMSEKRQREQDWLKRRKR